MTWYGTVPLTVSLLDEFQTDECGLDLDLIERIMAVLKQLPTETLANQASGFIVEDDLLAIAGFHVMWDGYGVCWSLISEKAREKPIALSKWFRGLVVYAETSFYIDRLEMTVDASIDRDLQFAYHLGFEMEGRLRKYGPEGQDHYILSRISQ